MCKKIACIACSFLLSTTAQAQHEQALLAKSTLTDDAAIPTVLVLGHYNNSLGSSDASSQGSIRAELLKNKPTLRPGEILEFIPGMVVTQHSGDGKANQYFLRGFNLDHGTDFATHVNGVPVNMPTHAHGQGYSDINFLIPELVQRIDYRKGPYFATQGDFSAAGSADVIYSRELAPTLGLELGARSYRRSFAGGSASIGAGLKLLAALELAHNDGPWAVKENFRKNNAVLMLSDGSAAKGWRVSWMNYQASWTATDQIPERLLGQPYQGAVFGRFDSLDNTTGGLTRRSSLSGQWVNTGDSVRDEISLYAIHYKLALFSNFTYWTQGVGGDQFHQQDKRQVVGGKFARRLEHAVLGKESSTEWGVQLRRDNIRVGLFDAQSRSITATTREDHVRQLQTGLYVSNSTQWLPKLRTVTGLRWDSLGAQVQALSLPVNSGRSRAQQWSPKFSAVAGPFAKTELFFNAGRGFHSNDARGTTIQVDPKSGSAVDRVPGLAASQGVELGLRTEAISGLQSSVALWQLKADSELVYVGDAGNTEPGMASKRYGLEWSNRYTPHSGWLVDADLAWSHARFANGDRIDNAVERMATLSGTYKQGAWTSTLATRYIGAAPLTSDNSVRSRSSITTNLRLGYQARPSLEWGLDVLNLFNRRNDDIQYYYASQLPSDASPLPGRHSHPAEPRGLRLSMKIKL